MPKKPTPTEQRVVLSNVSWQQLEQLLAELGVERQTRLTYFRGKLELMTPIDVHERCHKLIESLILVLVDELALSVESIAAPITLMAPDIGCVAEPDACYYFQGGEVVHGKKELHFPGDPLPDLLVEVALSAGAIDKLPVYANLGIPEVWRYITTAIEEEVLKGKLLIYKLDDHRYIERQTSIQFPFLPAARVLQFLEESDSMSLSAALRLLRAWIQDKC